MRLFPTMTFALGLVLAGCMLAPLQAAQTSAIPVPQLKWQYGGCNQPPHYCQTGWYAGPAVADLDRDGKPEVIWGGYDLYALNGEDGSVQWRADNGSRIWPAVAVADLDGDSDLEIAVGRGSDQLSVYDGDGTLLWERNPFGAGEVRTLALADLEQDGSIEVIVGRASGGSTKQVRVYEANGTPRSGWPARREGEAGYGWGMYNENIAIADMDGDNRSEIFAPTDTHYITALDPNGNQLPANSIYGTNKVWSQVGVHVDHAVDLRGYAECGTEHRPNFANAAPAIADMDGDGTLELVVPGDVYNCGIGDGDGDLYYLPWILRADRSRWSGSGFDWTVLPEAPPASGPRSQDYSVIENAVANAVLADLDGDNQREILFASYDGRVHAFWLDKRSRGSWPYAVPGSGIRFAGEPVVVDLDNDGSAEVLFTSWPEKRDGRVGQLHVLNALGEELHRIDLPAPGAGADWNGGLAAPTVANIDADADLELVIGTSHSGVAAYDLPGSADARILWGTARGNQQRNGQAPTTPGLLSLNSDRFAPRIEAGGSSNYTISVGGVSGPVQLSIASISGPEPLPHARLSSTTITAPGQVTLTLDDQHGGPLPNGAVYEISLTAVSGERSRNLTLYLTVGGPQVYLPLLRS